MIRHAIAALALLACTPPHAPQPDASDAASLGDVAPNAVCVSACSNLAAIGCIEGADVNCVVACTKNATGAPIAVMPAACWSDAGTKEAARACGGVSCP